MQLATQNTFSLTPTNLQEAVKFAEILAKSTIVPRHYQNKSGDILVAVQMGAELGLKPIQALQNIAVINGKPSVYGDALLALVQNNPNFEDIKESFDEETNTAYCTVKRKGQSEYTVSFCQEDAKKAGLWGKSGPWTSYPKRMLQMRARGFALRDKFADALGGLITAEEARDYPVDVTPQVQVKKQDLSSKLNNVLLEQKQPHDQELEEERVEDNIELSQLIVTHNVPSEVVSKWCEKANVNKIEDFPENIKNNCINHILNKYQQVVTLEETQEVA
jgi:hypothetical protein